MMMETGIGILAATLLWLALLVKLTRRWLPRKLLVVVLLVGLAIALVPFNRLHVGGYIFSLTSYLSVSSVMLLLGFLFANLVGEHWRGFNSLWQSRQQWTAILIFFAIAGLFLYPMTAGLTLFDPYRLGYLGTPLSVALVVYLFGWALLCVVKRWYLLLLLLLMSVIVYYLKWLPSLNLWDYVIDPLVVIYSIFSLLKSGGCWLLRREPSTQQVS